MTYLQALKQLQYWLTNNQASRANHLNFNVHPLSTDELHAIREYTQNKLPESYYLFLQQCGTGDFFYSWYTSVIDQTASQTPKIEIYNLAQLKEQNRYYQQLLREELDDLPPDEHPDIASRSLHLHQPRAWLRHSPYLRATQILKPRCRVCAVRTHAFFAVQIIISNVQTTSNVVWKLLE
ncbi:SMI1/KNR4 family protein [Neisseria flavescens]|uniref:SMI1/KNR4 family protein n=1 Tax=Neisseria flavescens TaxID=484 RepID=UPI000ADE07FA|nr:SMI1/KNR4 family protein [Neisseria flavescens]